ncbi:hypothetical protein KKC88_05005 [Patescibacteria group bacterium]|nr:hypothetical protein [Patescibacteria group bacterium]MBU1673260.1 hypothetical protein [Patescibacteria group bacterium]MBU1963521.1 hypothetical protein [Patescibacteria group bacterium]
MKKYAWIITIILVLILGLGFGWIYWQNHAYGAWGDDSPGYLYLAGRLLQGEPLVYQDELVQKGIEHFGDERLARWLTPTHHEIISPDGWLSSIYPVGLSYIMYWTATITGNDLSIYSVVPVLAALNLILIFLICQLLFKALKIKKWGWAFGLLAAITVGFSSLYYDYAISQPMREIPSLFFILLSVYLFLLAFYQFESGFHKIRLSSGGGGRSDVRFQLALIILSILCLGFSLNIRHTGVAFLPAYLVLFGLFWDKQKTRKINTMQISRLLLVFAILMIIPLGLTIKNSVDISANKEAFKKKDTSGSVVVSNIDHVTSLSPLNIFESRGKFKTENGGLKHYWDIMNNRMSWIPYFMILVIIGIIFIWRKNKFLSAFLALWVLGFLALFSMWINPYSRYMIVAFPALAILGSFGLYWVLSVLIPSLFKSKRISYLVGALAVLSILVIYVPAYSEVKENIELEVLKNKAISQNDLLTLIEIGDSINQEHAGSTAPAGSTVLPLKGQDSLPPILMFSGRWQYGLSETMETHTGLKTVRTPMEQEKFVFDNDQVREFMDKLMDEGYTIYFWQDSGTQAVTNDFLNKNYNLNEYGSYQFDLVDEVKIYELTPKD